jgi:large subunit ribosomal protein L30
MLPSKVFSGIKKGIVMAGKTTSKAGAGKLHIKWVRSAICSPVKHKLVVKGLGFTRLNQIIERPDTPAIRGMVKKVPHLVEIVEN